MSRFVVRTSVRFTEYGKIAAWVAILSPTAIAGSFWWFAYASVAGAGQISPLWYQVELLPAVIIALSSAAFIGAIILVLMEREYTHQVDVTEK